MLDQNETLLLRKNYELFALLKRAYGRTPSPAIITALTMSESRGVIRGGVGPAAIGIAIDIEIAVHQSIAIAGRAKKS